MLLLEICCYNITSCLIAEANGADRIEFCDNPLEGGTTPSIGSLKLASEKLQIPCFPIIRPRGGDFLYDEHEFQVMANDIKACKELGCKGIATGLLDADGSVDKPRIGKLVELAYPMSVTFHRAYDRAANPFEALEDIIQLGCQRILTSGAKPDATAGTELINQLVRQANGRIIIMPGAGVRSENIAALVQRTGAVEFHSSAKASVTSAMHFINDSMNENLQHIACDAQEVQKLKQALRNLS